MVKSDTFFPTVMSGNKNGSLEEGQELQQSPAAQRAPDVLVSPARSTQEYQSVYDEASPAESVSSANSFRTNLSKAEPGQQDSSR